MHIIVTCYEKGMKWAWLRGVASSWLRSRRPIRGCFTFWQLLQTQAPLSLPLQARHRSLYIGHGTESDDVQAQTRMLSLKKMQIKERERERMRRKRILEGRKDSAAQSNFNWFLHTV